MNHSSHSSQNWVTSVFFGLANQKEFVKGMQHAVNQIAGQSGIFIGDNLFTWHRNLSFLSDNSFMEAVARHSTTPVERAIIWRQAVVLWGARNGLRLQGDFVEAACYKGTTVRIVCDAIGFHKLNRRYYLYDLFEHAPTMPHHAMPEHSESLYPWVKSRFADLPNVIVTKGKLPDILASVAPKEIAFMHLDLNNAEAEVATLEILFERMVSGAILVLDDYGWLGYRAQKLAEDPWFAARGYSVLELPTGQGIVVK